MKKIALIAHPFGEVEPAGLGTSIEQLTSVLLKEGNFDLTIFTKGKPRRKLSEVIINVMISLPKGRFWLDTGLWKYRNSYDAFLFFTPFLPFFFTPKNSIVIVRDFGYKHVFKKTILGRLKDWIIFNIHKSSIRRAKKVVAISTAVKEEVVDLCMIDASKVVVVYNGLATLPRENLEVPSGVRKPFFLSVGVVKERKNIRRSVEAFIHFNKGLEVKYSMVIAGTYGGSYYEQIQAYIKKEGAEEDVVFLGYVSDEELAYLYKHAEALVFPSLVEGFGKPVIEAMSFGTPVITSNEAPLNEVVNDAALLVDPYSVKEISDAMKELVIYPEKASILSQKGLDRAKDFSWEKTGQQISKHILEML